MLSSDLLTKSQHLSGIMLISSILHPFDVRFSFWACGMEDAAGLRRASSALIKR